MNNMKCYHYCLSHPVFNGIPYYSGIYYSPEYICNNTDYNLFYNYAKQAHKLQPEFVVMSLTLLNP